MMFSFDVVVLLVTHVTMRSTFSASNLTIDVEQIGAGLIADSLETYDNDASMSDHEATTEQVPQPAVTHESPIIGESYKEQDKKSLPNDASMSVHEATELVAQPTVTHESPIIEESDKAQNKKDLPNEQLDELTTDLPAKINDTSLLKVISCSKEHESNETLSIKENDEQTFSTRGDISPSSYPTDVTKNPHIQDTDSCSIKDALNKPSKEIKKTDKLSEFVPESGDSAKLSSDVPSDDLNENVLQPSESTKDSYLVKTPPSTEIPLENDNTTDVPKESSKTTVESSKESAQSNEEYAEHLTYTDDGTAIYTDPKTQYKYKWCEAKNNWVSLDDDTAATTANTDDSHKSNPYENEHYRWCTDTNQWIPKTTTTAPASSQTETEHYRWDAKKNEWILKSQVSLDNVTYGYEDGVRTYTDKDGAVFFWDIEKKAWFPKIDDDFMARYQMSYGFIDNTTVTPAKDEVPSKEIDDEVDKEQKVSAVPVGGVKRKAPPEPPKWFDMDQAQNTKVYVSNLPLDIKIEEFAEIMSKCGMIMRDPQTQKQKLKLYTEKDGQVKGDGLCDYIKVESVELALNLLDESMVRGNKIKVQRAKFEMRGEYNPTLKPKRKKKDKEKIIKMKEKLFDWRPEKMRGERSKHEKIVIIKNLFTPELFDKEVQLIIDYQNDLREECSKCGTVRKVVIFDRHVEGVAQINMADPDEADVVVQMMNGRFFGKRKLIAEIWDGKTKYKVAETEKEVQERINKWDKYLEEKEDKEEKDKARLANSVASNPNPVLTKEEEVENVLSS